MVGLLSAGIKVRDLAHEPTLKALKAPEVFDLVRNLIALDLHLRNLHENAQRQEPLLARQDGLGRALADLRGKMHPRDDPALAYYTDFPDEKRYPFIVMPPNQEILTPSQRVWLRRRAGLPTHRDDYADREFFRV